MKKECVHDFTENSTFVFPNKRFMIHPEHIMCHCKSCHKIFKYRKNSEGQYEIVNK